MRIVDIITTKRDGGELSNAEIEFFITKSETPPRKAGGLVDVTASKAVVLQGLQSRTSRKAIVRIAQKSRPIAAQTCTSIAGLCATRGDPYHRPAAPCAHPVSRAATHALA